MYISPLISARHGVKPIEILQQKNLANRYVTTSRGQKHDLGKNTL